MASRAHGWEIRTVPTTVAPPPRTGESAQGPWSAAPSTRFAPDHAEPEPITAGTPTLPEPVATARTVATGLFFATVALVLAGTVLGTMAAIRLLASGHVRLQFGDVATALMAVSFAVAYTALLLALTRNWAALRPSTLILAVVGSLAWPLSGFPLLAALLVTIAVGLSLGRDHRRPGGHRLHGIWALAATGMLALALVVAGLATAEPSTPPQTLIVPTTDPSAPSQAGDDTATDGKSATGDEDGAEDATGANASTDTDVTADTDFTAATGGETGTNGADVMLPTGEGGLGLDAEAGPGEFVAAYYRALDERRFDAAWASLSPAVRTSFGGLEHWRNGYGRTLSSTPREIAVTTPSSGTATVKHMLVARDKGCAEQRFAVTWKLQRVSGDWRVDVLRASALSPSRC